MVNWRKIGNPKLTLEGEIGANLGEFEEGNP